MNRPLTSFDRAVSLDRLASERFDVLVIGGGITGAGVALDAAARGLRTALVEGDDFASGTSSKSSKLVHGGLRYLQQKELGLVHQNLTERRRLLSNAPHLVEPLAFAVPLFGKGGVISKSVVKSYSGALWMYDLSGGWRIGHHHERVSAKQIRAHLPTMRPEGIVSGFVFYDAHTDDARLTLTVMRTAALEYGAVAANYAPVTGFLRDAGGRVRGARVLPVGGERTIEVRASAVVNATGVWADEILTMSDGIRRHDLRPAKGVHITVPRSRLPCDIAAIVPVPGDRRSIFVIPWGEHTYLGTTDEDYAGSLDKPDVSGADVDYLLGAINAVVTEPLSRADVTGAWAGLRPLLATSGHGKAPSARTADLSRRHRVLVSADGLVTIVGGKLTTYRKMAEDTVVALGRMLGRRFRSSPTRRLRLRGADGVAALSKAGAAAALGVDGPVLGALLRRYGGEAPAVAGLIAGRQELADPLVPGLPYFAGEAVYAARYEMAQRLEDVLARRTRALLLDAEACRRAAPAVAGILQGELGWDAARTAEEVAAVDELVRTGLAGVRAQAAP